MSLKDSLKVGPWPGGAPFLSEIGGDGMADNTITARPNILTPVRLREALNQWCEEQPGVVRPIVSTPLSIGHEVFVCSEDRAEPDWSGVSYDFSGDQGGCLRLIGRQSFLALTTLAIEHRYIPWLRLATTLPYTGAKAALLALGALRATEGEEK